MADVDIYTWLPDIAVEAPGCPEPVQQLALRRAAQQFFDESDYWRVDVETVTTATGSVVDAEYTPMDSITWDVQVKRVIYVEVDDAEVAADDYTFNDEGVLEFDDAPSDDGLTLLMRCVILPDDSCHSYPDYLTNKWRRAIVAGALAILKDQSKRPWSDPDGATRKWREYQSQVGAARMMIVTGREDANVGVQMRDFV